MKKAILIMSLGAFFCTVLNAAPTYEYKRELREGARGKWLNLRQHLNSGTRLEKELVKVDQQIDKKTAEKDKKPGKEKEKPTPEDKKEQIISDWEATKKYDNVGITIKEYIK